MLVYLIYTGRYEDRQVAAVTLSEDEAKYLKIFHSNPNEEAELEIYDTEENAIINTAAVPNWRVCVKKKDGAIIGCHAFMCELTGFTIYENLDHFLVFVKAKDEKEAAKKADEKIKKFVELERKIKGDQDNLDGFRREI
jgi:hypothetical protein